MSAIINSTRRSEIVRSLASKEYRDAFIEAEINTTLPFQIRAMRTARGWTQTELAQRTGQKQKTISDFENPSYGRLTLSSLKRLASACDVGLVVRFAPFSELVDWTESMSKSRMEVPSFDRDKFSESAAEEDSAGSVFFFSSGEANQTLIGEHVIQTFSTTVLPTQFAQVTSRVSKTIVSDSPFRWLERTGTE